MDYMLQMMLFRLSQKHKIHLKGVFYPISYIIDEAFGGRWFYAEVDAENEPFRKAKGC